MKRLSSEPDLRGDGHYSKRYPYRPRKPLTELLYDKTTANLLNDAYTIPIACFLDVEQLLTKITEEKKNDEVEYIKYIMYHERKKCFKYIFTGTTPQIYLERLKDIIANKYFSPDYKLNNLIRQVYLDTKSQLELRIQEIMNSPNIVHQKVELGEKEDFVVEYETLLDEDTEYSTEEDEE